MADRSIQQGASGKTVAVAVAIIIRDKQCLICRRKSDAVLANMWEFPGGKIEPGESPEQCAVREVQEELDLVVESLERLDTLTHTYPHAMVNLTPVVCRIISGIALPIGCADFKWVGIDELTRYTFPPANDAIVRHLVSHFL